MISPLFVALAALVLSATVAPTAYAAGSTVSDHVGNYRDSAGVLHHES